MGIAVNHVCVHMIIYTVMQVSCTCRAKHHADQFERHLCDR